MNIPNEVNDIIYDLESHGFEAYVVGGCVRDCLIGVTPKDWDITTNAKPDEIKKIFSKTVDTGIKHGTVTVLINGKHFEVTTFRTDGEYIDCRRPQSVLFVNDLLMDLSRRDFTINAIAYNKKNGLIDPFDGQIDIEKRIIRCVGNADKRFNEDALRMMRALRFSNQLNFTIETETYKSICRNAELIKFISIERIRDELIKLFSSRVLDNLEYLADSGVLKYVSLDFHNYLCDNIPDLRFMLECSVKDISVLFATLLYKFKNPFGLMKFLRFDNKSCDTIKVVLDNLGVEFAKNSCLIKKMISNIGRERFDILIDVQKNIGLAEDSGSIKLMANKLMDDCIFLKDLAVNGRDMIKLGFKNKEVGVVLSYLLDVVHRYPDKNSFDE